jgi:hypothetical protein
LHVSAVWILRGANTTKRDCVKADSAELSAVVSEVLLVAGITGTVDVAGETLGDLSRTAETGVVFQEIVSDALAASDISNLITAFGTTGNSNCAIKACSGVSAEIVANSACSTSAIRIASITERDKSHTVNAIVILKVEVGITLAAGEIGGICTFSTLNDSIRAQIAGQ